MFITFGLTVSVWVFFRADNIGHAFDYLSEIFLISIRNTPTYAGIIFLNRLLLVVILLEWMGIREEFAIQTFAFRSSRPVRFTFYYALLLAVFWFASETVNQQFIYFQF